MLGYTLADSPRPNWQILALVFVVAFSLGAVMELLQTTLPHRHASGRDLVSNAVGATVAVGIWRLLFSHARLSRVS